MRHQCPALLLLLLLCSTVCYPPCAQAQSATPADDDLVLASPNEGWSEIPPAQASPSIAERVLLWLPNRVMDFWDIFRVDGGIGPGLGGTVRATRYLQASHRSFHPASLRMGAMGRRVPVMWENTKEHGVTLDEFLPSAQRDVCTWELGAGADVLLLGFYIGVCPEEMVDFVAGFVFLDTEDDEFGL